MINEDRIMNKSDAKKRLEYIDVARGIAIVLVVLQHSVGGQVPELSAFILSFHMPLFFFLSGMFAKPAQNISQMPASILHKCKVLLVPQITLSVVCCVQSLLEGLAQGESLAASLSFSWGWFLSVLFMCTLLFILVTTLIKDTQFIKIVLLIVSFFSILVVQNTTYSESSDSILVSHLSILPVAFFFFMLGNLLKNKIINQQQFPFGLLVLTVVVVLSNINSPVLMYLNEYGNIYLFIISAVAGIYGIIYLSRAFVNNYFLRRCGTLSVQIYVWNFLVVKIISHASKFIWGGYNIENNVVVFISGFIISMLILYGIANLTDQYLPYIYGRNSKKIR